ncbi:MAG TPA: hypothetical protein VF345_11455 [Chthoniobacterales bacterium]
MKRALSRKPGSSLFKSHLNDARGWPRLTLVVLLLFSTAHRLPAPIVEAPENPTPAPEQASKPKWKRSMRANSRATSSNNESAKAPATSGPGRFAGSWSGTISQGVWGNVQVPLAINADGTSVKMTSGERPATVNGNTITWKSGLFNEITWTLTLQSNRTTAFVTSKSGLGVNGTATFSRTQNPVASAPTTKSAVITTASTQPADVPTAKQVPDKPGFVYNPFDPKTKLLLDVRDKAHGATVRDPVSGRLFIVP